MNSRARFLCAQGLVILLATSCGGPPPPCMSPDGRHQAQIQKRDGKWCVVRDGRPGKGYKLVVKGSLIFDPLSARLAYVAQEDSGRFLVVVDDTEGPLHEDIGLPLRFSPDGRRIAYAAKDAGMWCVMLDMTPGPRHTVVYSKTIRFSADGSRIAYGAEDSAGLFLWVEDQYRQAEAYGPYDGMAPPVFSHDGARFACAVKGGDMWAMVVDGVEESIAGAYGKGTPIFSEDGTKVGYTARLGGRWFLVVDGEVLGLISGEASERTFVATIEEAFWSPELHRLRPGVCLLAAVPSVTFKDVDGREVAASALELTPGSHAITVDYSSLLGEALGVKLEVDLPTPGIYLLTSGVQQYGYGKQIMQNLLDVPKNLLNPFSSRGWIAGEVSFDVMNVRQLQMNYMTIKALAEGGKHQVLGILRQRWRPAWIRRAVANAAANMAAEGKLEAEEVVPVLVGILRDRTEDRQLRETVWKKLVELNLAPTLRKPPPDLKVEDP